MIHSRSPHTLAILYPVILPVGPKEHLLSGADRAKALSRLARQALAVCREKSGLNSCDFVKNSQGAPIPNNGVYWSVTHKPEYVAGMLGQSPIGIDLEKIRPIHQGLFHKVADDAQWGLDDSEPLTRFFRYWTAKEAVLKACGVGLRDLSRCRIEQVISSDRVLVRYRENLWSVFQIFFDGHIAAAAGQNIDIFWEII